MTAADFAPGQQLLELRDVHLPPPPGWWPPAPGWWLLGVLLLVLSIATGFWLHGLLRRRRRRREILNRLNSLNQALTPEQIPRFLTEVSILLRRVAVARHPRREVAALSGDAWLRFLDDTGGGGQFEAGSGRVLGEGPYRQQFEAEPEAVLSLAREWILKNLRQTRRPEQ